jgi:hypothetical protein
MCLRSDVDGSGQISLSDFKAVLLDGTPSVWLSKSKIRGSLKGAVTRLTSVSKLATLPAKNGKLGSPMESSGDAPDARGRARASLARAGSIVMAVRVKKSDSRVALG